MVIMRLIVITQFYLVDDFYLYIAYRLDFGPALMPIGVIVCDCLLALWWFLRVLQQQVEPYLKDMQRCSRWCSLTFVMCFCAGDEPSQIRSGLKQRHSATTATTALTLLRPNQVVPCVCVLERRCSHDIQQVSLSELKHAGPGRFNHVKVQLKSFEPKRLHQALKLYCKKCCGM